VCSVMMVLTLDRHPRIERLTINHALLKPIAKL
jgi:hypothetical protein